MDDDMFEDDVSFSDTEEVFVDLAEIEASAIIKRRIFFACCISVENTDSLWMEAEMLLFFHEYRSALIAGFAADARRTPRRAALETIALYQLGDKSAAMCIVEDHESQIISCPSVSHVLKKKFLGTCEVLRFMPQLLAMLRAQQDNR